MESFPAPWSVDVALSARSHERIGGRRTDAAWLAGAWAAEATRVVVLRDGRFPVTEDGRAVRWVPPGEAPQGERLLLGERDGVVHFALLAEQGTGTEHTEPETGDGWSTLRESGHDLSAADQGLLVQAQSLSEWHQAHRFCPRCGGRLESSDGGYVLRCTACGRHQFPRSDPAVIMLVADDQGRALLGRQPTWPAGRFSTLAGFVDPGESLEQAVAREVKEEAGIEVTDVTYFGNQPWPFPASLMVGFFARAVTTEISLDDDELDDARWFSRDDVRRQTEAGTLGLPGRISISRSLIEAWYGGALPGSW